ncbi:SDR family NAD(P)-dependent oxidoreductase [Streptomyces sp. NBC_00233]|uniref:SDR family NAD(P)-dependent oxidoreductase n=1 Tax=Streptomyces sp. NBC_00233 TaxID=2975686 RepID=UPI002257275A|nr:SDR family NAD(P)-dependent oxidoreductase [Streptomyces sp. NBC_00233]MCX5232852.1 SDR family oxidoreductase [Streptomyces sp. NBC_00233]
MRRLEGKVALISGTARGLGRAAALRFAAEGALVVCGDLLHDEALETQREIGREGGTALTPGPLDVTCPESVEAWVGEAVEAFGGVDIVLTNAGSVWFGPLTEQSYDDYAATVRSALDSVWLTTRAAWPHLARSRGCVVTVGSTAGITGSLTNHRTAHSAAKDGVIALTRRLAAEGAEHGIRANCVSPGLVATEGSRGDLLADTHPLRDAARHIPLGRLGTPQDVASVAAFLASEDASYVSGTHLIVDGGWSAVLPGPLT